MGMDWGNGVQIFIWIELVANGSELVANGLNWIGPWERGGGGGGRDHPAGARMEGVERGQLIDWRGRADLGRADKADNFAPF